MQLNTYITDTTLLYLFSAKNPDEAELDEALQNVVRECCNMSRKKICDENETVVYISLSDDNIQIY